MEQSKIKSGKIVIEARKRTEICGVTKIITSSDNRLSLETVDGAMYIDGKDFKITSYDENEGKLAFVGEINCLKYAQAKLPLARRLLK